MSPQEQAQPAARRFLRVGTVAVGAAYALVVLVLIIDRDTSGGGGGLLITVAAGLVPLAVGLTAFSFDQRRSLLVAAVVLMLISAAVSIFTIIVLVVVLKVEEQRGIIGTLLVPQGLFGSLLMFSEWRSLRKQKLPPEA